MLTLDELDAVDMTFDRSGTAADGQSSSDRHPVAVEFVAEAAKLGATSSGRPPSIRPTGVWWARAAEDANGKVGTDV
jgi:hypothetical protein